MTTLSHTHAGRTSRTAVLSEAKRNGVVLAREVLRRGIHTQTLTRLVAEGRLERVSRGVYAWPDADVTEHHSLVLASAAVPNGVVCLVSALVFHGIGTQLPHEVWLALDRRARKPSAWAVPMRVVRFSGTALTFGVEEHHLEAKTVRVYSLAKTVADCFKYRNKIGMDVALEALRDGWAQRKLTIDALWHHAAVNRVANVMRPYLESVTV